MMKLEEGKSGARMAVGGKRTQRCLAAGSALILTCNLWLVGGVFAATASKKPAPQATPAKTSAKAKSLASSKAHSKSRKSKRSRRASWRRGQQKMDSVRAREIQSALIREHYLQGTPSGSWDLKSQKAMEKFQADHGWQTKVVPDSRALIKLGLGPNHDHLLNPETAMTGPIPVPAADPPDSPDSTSVAPAAGNAAGASQPQQ